MLDATDLEAGHQATCEAVADVPLRLWIHNKADLLPSVPEDTGGIVHVSARSRLGLETLRVRLRELAGGDTLAAAGGEFSARGRHVEALQRAQAHAEAAQQQLLYEHLELAAEELRLAHDALGEITGRVSPDDMLGRIFSTFCIGK